MAIDAVLVMELAECFAIKPFRPNNDQPYSAQQQKQSEWQQIAQSPIKVILKSPQDSGSMVQPEPAFCPKKELGKGPKPAFLSKT
jgi:hypothetical protein